MARATGKEAIRLWFEFLKRACHAEDVTVNTKHYQAWGDVANTKFEAWWRAHAEQLFPNKRVEITQRYLVRPEQLNFSNCPEIVFPLR